MQLVLTSDSRFFPEHDDIIYLGRWALPSSYTQFSYSSKIKILPYVYNKKGLYYRSYHYLQGVYGRLSPQLFDMLNSLHEESHDDRFWELVVGYWFREYIEVLYERYLSILNAREKCNNIQVNVLDSGNYYTPNNSREFDSLIMSDLYNHQLYSQIIDFLGCFNAHQVEVAANSFCSSNSLKILSVTYRKQLIKWLSMKCSRANKYYFASTYMPLPMLIGLSIRLKIFPSLDTPFPNFKRAYLNDQDRDLLTKMTVTDEFEELVRKTIKINFPQLYLENFYKLERFVRDNFPKRRVKLIMTGNAFAVNDGFKLWAAKQIERFRTPFVILQHGGNYGCSEVNSSEDYETMVADYYLTYGWSDKKKDNIVSFIPSRMRLLKKKKPTNLNSILWVLQSLPKYSYSMFSVPVSSQFRTYIDEQVIFLNSLDEKIRKILYCRPSPFEYGWNELDEIKIRTFDFKLANMKQALQKNMLSHSLYVCTYNATAHLEALAANIPLIMYWNPNHWRLRESAVPYHDQLKELGVLHDTPLSAAKKINEIISDPYDWWFSTEIQAARETFCQQFVNVKKKTVRIWVEKIKEIALERAEYFVC